MEVKTEQIIVSTDKRNADGKQIDPEERPAVRELVVDVPVRLGGKVLGSLAHDGHIQTEGTVGFFAHQVQHECWSCKWYDNVAWRALKARMERSGIPAFERALATVRTQFVDHATAHLAQGPAVEAAVNELGICQAMTEIYKEVDVSPLPVYLVGRLGGCPTVPGPKGEDLTLAYEPRSSETKLQTASLYDAVMRAAQGKNRP